MRYQVMRTALTFVIAQTYHFRIWVENSGKSRADQVQVFVSRLFRRAADGTFREDRHFSPMNLKWSYGEEVYAQGISPGMGKHCDFGRIVEPDCRSEVGDFIRGVASEQTIFSLITEWRSNTGSHLLAPGTYRIELRLAAANSRPVSQTVELTVSGNWFADEERMFQDGIGLRVV